MKKFAKTLDKLFFLCYNEFTACERVFFKWHCTPVTASLLKRQVRKMYAVIETGGKQYQVNEGDVIFIEKLTAEADETVTFDKVSVVGAEDGIKIGTPYVDGATVEAKVIKNGKAKKITVFTYKPKKAKRKSRVTDSLTLR